MPELPVLTPFRREYGMRDRAVLGLLVTGAILGGAVVGIVKCRGLAENAGHGHALA